MALLCLLPLIFSSLPAHAQGKLEKFEKEVKNESSKSDDHDDEKGNKSAKGDNHGGYHNDDLWVEVIYDIAKLLRVEPEACIEFVEDRLGHDFRYAIDTSKIAKELKWKPKYTFEKGLLKTVSHYKSLFDMEFKDTS